MRRENAGCVMWRSSAERLKLRVSASETKSSSHLSSMLGPCFCGALGGEARILAAIRPAPYLADSLAADLTH